MPSKRKKNKRRMRRVQAQRRALEEQHAANPPIKASSGTAVSAPPIETQKKAAKTSPPTREKLPQTIPLSVPVVESLKVELEPVVKEDAPEAFQVEIAAAESGGVPLERATAELEGKSRVADEVEGPARVTKEAPPVETLEPFIIEADLAKEAEAAASETEPISEVAAPDEAPEVVTDEAKTEDNEFIETDTDQTHDVCEAESEKAAALAKEETETKEEQEVTITEEATISEPAVEDLTSDQYPAAVEPAAEKHETDSGSEEETVTETLDPADEAEKVSPEETPEDGEEQLDELVEEDSAELSDESVTAAEDTPVPSVEIPMMLNTIPEAPLDEADPPVVEATEGAADLLIQELSAAASVSTVKDVSSPAVVQQETEGAGDTFTTKTESMDAPASAEPETDAAAPAGENPAVDQMFQEVVSEETKSGGCDIPRQVQLPVEPVHLGAVELSAEITQNGNIVPEVSIEG